MYIVYETDPNPATQERNPLATLGWDDFFAASLASLGRSLTAGRVVEARRGSFVIAALDAEGTIREMEAKGSGALSAACATRADWPVTGDWVAVREQTRENQPTTGSQGLAIVEAVLPRRSAFSRKAPGDPGYNRIDEQVLAANIDTSLIVAAAGNDFSLRRIERYVALAMKAHTTPVIVITKADLAGDTIGQLVDQACRVCPPRQVVAVCAPDNEGLEALLPFLPPGSTAVLLGSSGSGKSTLLNALAGRQANKTGSVRSFDQRGRHTTTSRTMFSLPSGAMIIDTPGLREVQLRLDEDSLDSAFPEIEEAAASCRFRDCTHTNEPGCAVKQALDDGTIAEDRYKSWLDLGRESRFIEARSGGPAQRAEKARWKTISKLAKAYKKGAWEAGD
ncbi:MAG: ribosome small subunit-dependent GTPase A [Clostridia bacterium]|jgi:ribosome biogenesis GTPase